MTATWVEGVDAWNVSQLVTLQVPDDDVWSGLWLEYGAEITAEVVGDLNPEFSGALAETVTVTVADNDPSGIVVSMTRLDVVYGGSAAYNISLASQPITR